MTEIRNVKVYDLKECMIASGLAMRTELCDYSEEEFAKALGRCIQLVNASRKSEVKCHDNFLTGVRVSFDIKYPQYLSPEMQRYHFLDIVTSMSKMHRLSKMELKTCCNEYVSPDIIRKVQEYINDYNSLLQDKKARAFKYWHYDRSGYETCEEVLERERSIYAAFMTMVSNCPLGLELWMHVSTNYKQLQTIYHQRKNHKLKEDWGTIIGMIERLPYFKQLILGEE